MFERLKTFLQDVKQEITTKVSWPTKDELMGSTMVVLVVSSIFIVFVFVVDYGLNSLLRLIFP